MRRSAPRPSEAEIGAEIAPLRKIAYQRALDELKFSRDSIHNDEYTRRHGYAGALMSAYVLCGYMSELMVNFFGHEWMRGSEISLTFINGGVQQGDEVVCRGRITARAKCDEGIRLQLEIWMEKSAARAKVVAGKASGVIRS